MDIARILQYECKVCGRRIDVTRTGDVYEEPVYCCGLESTEVGVPETEQGGAPAVRKKPARKKAVKKAVKKAKKKAKKKAVKKAAKKKIKKKAAKKTVKARGEKTAKKKAKKKTVKKRR